MRDWELGMDWDGLCSVWSSTERVLEASNKVLFHLLLLCPSLCAWGAVRGALQEDKSLSSPVRLENTTDNSGSRTAGAGGFGALGDGAVSPDLGPVLFLPLGDTAWLSHVPNSPVQSSVLAQELLADPH